MATIKDIAALAGVSVGTVSNVINGEKNVSPKRVQSVNNAIKALGYIPNSIARTLKTHVSKTVGLILPDITNPFYAELARGVEDSLNESGYALFLCNKDRNKEKEHEYLNILLQKNVDGIIVVKPTAPHSTLTEIGEQLPLVLIDFSPSPERHYAILNVDDGNSARLLMDYLYAMGHRRIAYFSGNMDAYSDICRQDSYIQFMKEKGLFDERLIYQCKRYDMANSYQQMIDILENETLPDAVFAANDILAIGAIHALHDRHLNVPEDISVVGCDNILLSSFIAPGLTTINRPKYELGKQAAQTLLNMISDISTKEYPQETLISELVLRHSVQNTFFR